MAEPASEKSSSERVSRGAFPRLALNKTIELVEAVYELGNGESVRRVTAFSKINKSPDSGTSRQLVATANTGYGLIKGNASSTHLELTDRGLKIAAARPGAERLRQGRESLMENAIFKATVEKYEHRVLPNDEVVVDFLRASAGLSDADAKLFLAVAKENMRDYGFLVTESNGRTVVVDPAQEKNPSATDSSDNGLVDSGKQSRSQPREEVELPRSSVNPVADPQLQIAFNIQIQLPSDAPAETYEAIFKNIAQHLLGRNVEEV